MNAVAESAQASGHAEERRWFRQQIERLPVTMRPALNKQVTGWDDLFPSEQTRLVQFLSGLKNTPDSVLDGACRDLRAVEAKMDLVHAGFSVDTETMLNASILARSSAYAQWRSEVQKIFALIQSAAPASDAGWAKSRLVLLVFPETLPVTSYTAHGAWDPLGVEYRIEGDAREIGAGFLKSEREQSASGGGTNDDELVDRTERWLIDAGSGLGRQLPASESRAATILEFAGLKGFREEFLARANTVPKDLAAADGILEKMRRADWSAWWPRELAADRRLRSFVTELFLSGNGAMIFANSFVQWAAAEAIRRAQPRLVVARFGMRSKPKPFTSIAVFENQQKISAMQDEDDLQGSATDALMLARYVWLSALRHAWRDDTYCVCVAESMRSIYLIAPVARRPQWSQGGVVPVEDVAAWMRAVLG